MPIIGVIDSSKSGNLTPTTGYVSLASFRATNQSVTQVTFSSIPSIYKHLEIRASVGENVTNNNAFLRVLFNNDTSTSAYISAASRSYRYTISSGGNQVTQGNSLFTGYGWIYLAGTTQDSPSSDLKGYMQCVARIYNYAQTYNYKNASAWGWQQQASQDYSMGRGWGSWHSTAAINRLDFLIDFAMVEGSTISVYGIA